MIKVIGIETGKVYVKGHRNDCFRWLQRKYPSSVEGVNHRNRRIINKIYPEPLLIKRIPKIQEEK